MRDASCRGPPLTEHRWDPAPAIHASEADLAAGYEAKQEDQCRVLGRQATLRLLVVRQGVARASFLTSSPAPAIMAATPLQGLMKQFTAAHFVSDPGPDLRLPRGRIIIDTWLILGFAGTSLLGRELVGRVHRAYHLRIDVGASSMGSSGTTTIL
jgi:hypothetical protein